HAGCVGPAFCVDKTSYDVLLPGYNGRTPAANAVGMTDTGRALVRELMRRGMLIGVQHMSERGVNGVLCLVGPALGLVPRRGGASGSALLTQNSSCSTLDIGGLDANPSCKDSFYPVMSSHGGVRYISGIDPAYVTIPDRQNENARSSEQIRRIYQIGGT